MGIEFSIHGFVPFSDAEVCRVAAAIINEEVTPNDLAWYRAHVITRPERDYSLIGLAREAQDNAMDWWYGALFNNGVANCLHWLMGFQGQVDTTLHLGKCGEAVAYVRRAGLMDAGDDSCGETVSSTYIWQILYQMYGAEVASKIAPMVHCVTWCG